MERLKVMTILGTRPEIIRLSECIKTFDTYFDHILVHTGQNWAHSLNRVFFDELGLRNPDYCLDAAGASLGETMGNIIARSYEILTRIQPDAVVILGDTNSALSAISAKRLRIPIFHMEAGNRCFDQRVPEEINRRIVDHISDFNLAYTEHSRRYLLSEGLQKDRIIVTGSPMAEVISRHRAAISASPILAKLGLTPARYFVVSAHREENVDHGATFSSLVNALNAIAEQYQFPIIYSTHPRAWKRITELGIKFHPLVRQMEPFGFFDYNQLQMNAFCVLSDSGTLSEESAILGFPAVLIRDSTERPEVLDKGSIVVGGVEQVSILQSVALVRGTWMGDANLSLADDYLDENVSTKVAKLIQGYANLIRVAAWRKD